MRFAVLATGIVGAYVGVTALQAAVGSSERATAAHELRIPVGAPGSASLYARDIGRGQPIVVLHGGPDFDHSYFLPELDRLASGYHLIYYDQRGRGKSADGVRPEDVTIESEMADLEKVRESFHLPTAAIMGHSWGTVLALEYAIRHADRISHLILMNPAPASAADFAQFRQAYRDKLGSDLDRLKAEAATPGYKDGDPDAVTAYYRIHFRPALARPADLELLVARLRASFTREGVLKARAIEDRLNKETWLSDGYDLLPKLAHLRIPMLVVWSDPDFIPRATAQHIAQAVPNARFAVLDGCSHFAFLECPGPVRKELDEFFRAAPRSPAGGGR